MGNSSPSETGLIKGCLNQIKRMFYWTLGTFAVLIAIVVGIMLWEDLDRAERTAERKKEEEKILAAEAKLEGFESVTAYKAHKKKIEEQQEKIEEETEARSFGFDNYEAYDSFVWQEYSTRGERLSEHKRLMTAEAQELGFDSLAQYMDSRSRGV